MIVVEMTSLHIRKVFVHLKSDVFKRQLANVIWECAFTYSESVFCGKLNVVSGIVSGTMGGVSIEMK